jgi:thioesterase domain-containing protein
MDKNLILKDFIKELHEKEITISFSGGKLVYSGPEHNIDEELLGKLKKNKTKLIKYYWPAECPNMMPISPEGSKIPLILLHGGEVNYSLSEYLGADQPFYGFFYIGSEGEKIRYKTVESFARAYLDQLERVLPQGPYILGGLSFGGILAYEMAVQIQKRGGVVPALVLVDCGIYSLRKPEIIKNSFLKSYYKLYNLAKRIYYMFYHKSRKVFYDFFHLLNVNLPKEYRNAYIIWTYQRLTRYYKPATPFPGEILLFKSESNLSADRYLCWDRLCNNIKMVILKGTHSTMYNGVEEVKTLRENIAELLKHF